MKEKINEFEKKYMVQFELLDEDWLAGLDERTLHETIKAMLINTIKDCVKYENWMDPEMTKIIQLMVKENKTEDEIKLIKNSQNKLKTTLHFSRVAEEALQDLLYKMLLEDYIKEVFKQDIPALYENIYYLVDIEYEIAETLMFMFSELYEAPNYKMMCKVINNTIEEFILNAEEYFDDIKENELYEDFVEERKKIIERKSKEEANE